MTREEIRLQVAISVIQGVLETKHGVIGEVVPSLAVAASIRIADAFVEEWFGDAKLVAEKCFPELSESEDERIRMELIGLIKEIKNQPLKRLEDWDAYIDWLEKQKEQKSSAVEVLNGAGLKTFRDGNQWCILKGDNIQEGTCGFGDTIGEALYEFLNDWRQQLQEEFRKELPEWQRFGNGYVGEPTVSKHPDTGRLTVEYHGRWIYLDDIYKALPVED